MPEGDTIYRAAQNVGRVLTGQVLTDVQGSHPAIRDAAVRLKGSRVTRVRNHGKQHLIETDADLTIRTHMGMPGVWHVYERNARWAKPVGAARVILVAADHEVVCFSAPTVQVDRTDRIELELAQWGPDLTADTFDAEEALARIEAEPGRRTVADVLLDQRVMAGVGNVFKNEILFMERVHPNAPIQIVADEGRRRLIKRARQLVHLNRSRDQRITTGDMRRGRSVWVYGRNQDPCRRCGTPIASEWLGDTERVTYWCPSCQPAPEADQT